MACRVEVREEAASEVRSSHLSCVTVFREQPGTTHHSRNVPPFNHISSTVTQSTENNGWVTRMCVCVCGREGGGKQQLADCLNNDFAGSHQHSQAGIQPAVAGGLCPVFMSAAALAPRFTVVLQSQIVSSLFCLSSTAQRQKGVQS